MVHFDKLLSSKAQNLLARISAIKDAPLIAMNYPQMLLMRPSNKSEDMKHCNSADWYYRKMQKSIQKQEMKNQLILGLWY